MKISVPAKALIVVADGAHAHYYTNGGTAEIKLQKIDLPAASLDAAHRAGAMPKEVSPREQDESNFAAGLADTLYERFHNSDVRSIVLIADPQTLGQLRKGLHKEIAGKITGELHKTMTHASIGEIEKCLTAAVEG